MPSPAPMGRDHAAPGFDLRLMARALAALFAAGATLVVLNVALPHPREADVPGLLGVVAVAYAVAGVLYLRSGSMRPWMLQPALAWGTLLITAVAYFSGQQPSPQIFFYLWVFLYGAYFLSPGQLALQAVVAGAALGGVLAVRPPVSGGLIWWLLGMGTLVVAAVLVSTLRHRVEGLIARLYDAARTDPLTGLQNRRAYREALDLELERARRGGDELALLVADIDRFKQVNDRRGHQAGDATLQAVACLLEEATRRGDTAFRIGGEEFAMILPRTGDGEGAVVAERVRAAVAEGFAGEDVPVTMSFGLATYPRCGDTAAALVRAADEALYQAKREGRDRVAVHSEETRALRGLDPRHHAMSAERYLALVLELAEAVDLRFSGSARHSETVGRYAEMMAAELSLSARRVARVRLAGVLHDVGKVGVPDAILHKPGKLTDEEWAVVAAHPGLGAQILDHPELADLRDWVRAHHERPDGRGYPRRLADDELPLEARILAVADAYEAMTSDRSYRRSLGHDAAREELRRCAGTHFDAQVVEAFLSALRRADERAGALAVAAG